MTSTWTVRKGVDHLKAGDRFIFADDLGGEGQTLTALGPANNELGTRLVGTEELDFDLEFYGNAWVTLVSDASDTDPEQTDADFEHLREGMTVVVKTRETTWEPGDDNQTEVVLEPGTEATVIDWVVEWFHVHVETTTGQHAWVCPDNIKEKA